MSETPVIVGEHTPWPWKLYDRSVWAKAENGKTKWSRIVASTVSAYPDAADAPNACLCALAPTAPHECPNRDCPGNVNRRKLEAIEKLLAALREVAKGSGPFSRDPLTHAENTIEHMKKTAHAAIAEYEAAAKGGVG